MRLAIVLLSLLVANVAGAKCVSPAVKMRVSEETFAFRISQCSNILLSGEMKFLKAKDISELERATRLQEYSMCQRIAYELNQYMRKCK